MATTDLTSAPERAEHTGITAALSPAVTEPLSDFAAKLVDRLDLRLNAPQVLLAAVRYSLASRRTAEISRWIGPYNVTDIHMDDLAFAQDVMRESRAVLADAGRLDLIEVA